MPFKLSTTSAICEIASRQIACFHRLILPEGSKSILLSHIKPLIKMTHFVSVSDEQQETFTSFVCL